MKYLRKSKDLDRIEELFMEGCRKRGINPDNPLDKVLESLKNKDKRGKNNDNQR